jgi:hypothetical protein
MRSRESKFSEDKDSSSESSLTKLPRYKFAKSVKFSGQERNNTERWLDSARLDIPEDYEGLKLEWKEKISQTMDLMTLWMKNSLQLDPSEKLPGLEKIAFLNRKKFHKIAKDRYLQAYHEPNTGEILMGVKGKGDSRTITFFSHELIHLLSSQEVFGNMEEDIFACRGVSRSGYRRRDDGDNLQSGRFGFLNEGLTELLNIEFLNFSHSRDPENFVVFSWGEMCARAVLLDALIAKVSVEKNPNFRRDLYRNYFTGEMNAFRDLAAVIGKDNLRELGKTDIIPKDTESVLETAKKLGLSLSELQQKLEAILNGKPIFIANNIKVQTK